MNRISHPPKPRFALAVGVIGHRLNRLPEDVRPRIGREIGETLAAIRTDALAAHSRHSAHFANSAPKLTLVSAIAEGADRMAAEAALAGGFELEVPTPFKREEYEKDFDSQHEKNVFRALLDGSVSVLELEGDRTQSGKSYAAAGLVVLDNSDILIAVWDGGAAHGRGGTTELVHEAAARGMPVIRVDVTAANSPRLHWRGFDDRHTNPLHIDDHPSATVEQGLPAAIEALVRPPGSLSERKGLARFFAERSRRLTARIEFPLLVLLMGVRWPRLRDIFLPEPDNPRAYPPLPDSAAAVDRAFAWADAIALRFAQDFRSAVTTNFLVAAAAVLFGALSLRFPWSAIELSLVFLLVFNAFIGHVRHWHRRWIESREVAERLRVAGPMHALATRALGPFGAAATWPAWYARAMVREAGLRSGLLDGAGLAATRRSLLALVRGQANYHKETARRFRTLHDRLAILGGITFAAALVLAAVTFVAKEFNLFAVTAQMGRWAIVASASLPAFGSASYGIRVIGDFDGGAKQSARMKAQLDALATTIENGKLEFEWLRDRAHKASDVMLGDVAKWRLVVESRDLSMPG